MKLKTPGLIVAIFSISMAAYGGKCLSSEQNANLVVAANGTPSSGSQSTQGVRPPPRLLPLQLNAPPTAQVGIPLEGVSVTLQNPGNSAPNARLRLIVHDSDAAVSHRRLNPNDIKIEVLENGTWIPVLLTGLEGNVMGAIGPEGVIVHSERYNRGGFSIPAGLNKTWQLRFTFSAPGTYSLVAAVSPDNGSKHLAQPAHSIIAVQ